MSVSINEYIYIYTQSSGYMKNVTQFLIEYTSFLPSVLYCTETILRILEYCEIPKYACV